MDQKTLQQISSRTDAKLRYAGIYLDLLRKLEPIGGSDFDRAHQESFLFHLIGAKDSFLHEINVYLKIGLNQNRVKIETLQKVLNTRGVNCKESIELNSLQQDESSWLHKAIKFRNHSTHISYTPRDYHLGSAYDHQVWMRVSNSKFIIQRHFVDEFEDWLFRMTGLLDGLRSSVIISARLAHDLPQS